MKKIGEYIRDHWKELLGVVAVIVLIIVLLLTKSCTGAYNYVGDLVDQAMTTPTINITVPKDCVKAVMANGDVRVDCPALIRKDQIKFNEGCTLEQTLDGYYVNCPTCEEKDEAYWTRFREEICIAKCECGPCNKKRTVTTATPVKPKPGPTPVKPKPTPPDDGCWKTRVITSKTPIISVYITALDNPNVKVVTPGVSCSGRKCKVPNLYKVAVRTPCNVTLGYVGIEHAEGWSVDTNGAHMSNNQERSTPHSEVEIEGQPMTEDNTVKAKGGDWVYKAPGTPNGSTAPVSGDEATIETGQ